MNLIKKEDLIPITLESKLAIAENLAKSGLCPRDMNTKEKIFVALQWGSELGLTPMVALNNISVINGRPTLNAQLIRALVHENEKFLDEYQTPIDEIIKTGECKTILTKNIGGKKIKYEGYFSLELAKKANLISKDNWIKYPYLMLQHRSFVFAARLGFPESILGIYTPEEVLEIEEPKEKENKSEQLSKIINLNINSNDIENKDVNENDIIIESDSEIVIDSKEEEKPTENFMELLLEKKLSTAQHNALMKLYNTNPDVALEKLKNL
jgi:hypothetical protein